MRNNNNNNNRMSIWWIGAQQQWEILRGWGGELVRHYQVDPSNFTCFFSKKLKYSDLHNMFLIWYFKVNIKTALHI